MIRWRQRAQVVDDGIGVDLTVIDATLLPDFWNVQGVVDSRIQANGDPPEQLVKVTDRRHKHPVFATICSIGFLLTIISIIVICTH
uniref:Uncharacterized protein n=1 Tax=Globisporangium ultimum (strain ATCC 200006 / CBS 805.95 / DAOM BR144) TaxID=431595 RepID=K3WEK1_GLOUD